MALPAKPTLLVVEDNVVICAILRTVMRTRRGSAIDLLSAPDGKQGIEAARRQNPDIVLLDWVMPEYDGEYFLKQQALCPEIAGVPVLVYTSRSEEGIKETLKLYPAVKGFLHKPVVPTKLYDIVMPYLKRRMWSRDQPEAAR